jgi:hypothetical protein
MKEHKWSRRTFYLAAVVAIVASTSGFALASVLSVPTQVNQGANFYDGGNVGVSGYSSATLDIASTPNGTVACSHGPIANTSTMVTLVLSSTEGGTCAAGDWAEMFTLPFLSTDIITQTNTFTIYSQVGGSPVQTNFVNLTVGPGVQSSHFSATVYVYVDYGGPTPPTTGITLLDLIVH